MYVPLKRIGRIEFNFGKEGIRKLEDMLNYIGAAVIWASEEDIGAPRVLHEAKMH